MMNGRHLDFINVQNIGNYCQPRGLVLIPPKAMLGG